MEDRRNFFEYIWCGSIGSDGTRLLLFEPGGIWAATFEIKSLIHKIGEYQLNTIGSFCGS